MEKHSVSRSETIADDIISYIMNNKLQAGDKLPNEYELTQILDVGRSTLREGVKALISRNILEIRRGAGTYVSEKRGVAEDPLGLTFVNDKYKAAQDMLDVRMLLEPAIAARAAENATEEDSRKIRCLCDETERLIVAGENHLAADIELHTKIAECSKNLIMLKLVPVIHQSVIVFGELTKLALKQETIDTHRDIVDAICHHHSQDAYQAMYLHIIYNQQNIRKIMKRLREHDK